MINTMGDVAKLSQPSGPGGGGFRCSPLSTGIFSSPPFPPKERGGGGAVVEGLEKIEDFLSKTGDSFCDIPTFPLQQSELFFLIKSLIFFCYFHCLLFYRPQGPTLRYPRGGCGRFRPTRHRRPPSTHRRRRRGHRSPTTSRPSRVTRTAPSPTPRP